MIRGEPPRYFIMKEIYLLDHILKAELLQIDHKVIFMRNIHLDMALSLSFCLMSHDHIFLHSLGDMMNGKLFG